MHRWMDKRAKPIKIIKTFSLNKEEILYQNIWVGNTTNDTWYWGIWNKSCHDPGLKKSKKQEKKGQSILSLKAPMLTENGSSYFNFINNYSPNPLILVRWWGYNNKKETFPELQELRIYRCRRKNIYVI